MNENIRDFRCIAQLVGNSLKRSIYAYCEYVYQTIIKYMIEISTNPINVNFSTEGLTDEQMRDKVQSIQHRMKTVVDEVRALYDNYEVYYSWNDVHDKKTFLGEKENRVCRFCGVKKGEIAAGESKPCTFKKEAHALSNLIGNNHLFSYYE